MSEHESRWRDDNTVLVGGLSIHNNNLEQSVERLLPGGEVCVGGYCILANAHMGYLTKHDSTLSDIISSATQVYADGRPVFWAAKLLGASNLQHCRGEDVCVELINTAIRNKLKVGFYGCRDQTTLDTLLQNVQQRFPEIDVGWSKVPPMMQLQDVERDEAIIEEINSAGISVLFVGIGCPKQEYWMAKNATDLQCVSVGVGAVFDFISGQKMVAPKVFQTLGLEWVFRLFSDPKRLYRRYLIESPAFLIQVLSSYVSSKLQLKGK